MKQKWDPNNFKGKSEKNYETSYRIVAACVVIATLILTWTLVIELIKTIF